MNALLIACLVLVAFAAGMLYERTKNYRTMKLTKQFTDANWYLYELLNDKEEVVYTGVTKDPDQRLRQMTRLQPHKDHPNSSYGLFYGQNLTLDVVAGFENKKQALEALEILKEENDPDYLQKKLFRKQICSKAGRMTVESGNHNMQTRYECEDGHITTAVWMERYCLKRGLDPKKSVKIG